MRRIHGRLDGVDHHQFYLDAGAPEEYPQYPMDDASMHRLIATSGHAVVIETGIAMGVVGLTIDLLDAAPDVLDDTCAWQAVSEVSVAAVLDTAMIRLLMTDTAPPFDGFLLPAGPGWYRVRGHAIGRSLDYDAVVTEAPREHHLLQVWPALAPAAPVELRVDNQWPDP